jgi:DNA-binding CsgD family transcriptional regulator/tetratricopeptide (TPR) repeat protein
MASRMTSSRIVGRAAELAELEAALAEARDGRAALAFVAGESGVGKTRLVTELCRGAKAQGARVLCGDCVELGEGELPYAPLVAALRPLVREADPALRALPANTRAELATLLPELGPRAQDRPEEERGAAQRRLFEALLALLTQLGEEHPVVLALEDIHWADRSTRAFLAFLARSLGEERVLVIASYRSDELHRRHPLRPLLAELERDPRARRIALAPLGREELAAQLEDILGAPPDRDLLERLLRRSEGNPLFVEELLAAGGDGRGPLPPTLREALMIRIERLPDGAQELLRLLAAARRADHAVLAEASGLEPRVLRDTLREAVAGHIIVPDSEGRYAFRHALLREVVHDDLLPGEHAELHLALAQALEHRLERGERGVWVTSAVAHHYLSAGDQPAALRASVRAAAEAARVHAHGEAAALLERALELWDRVPGPEAHTGADHAGVLLRAADAHAQHGHDARRADLLEEALKELDEHDDPQRTAKALGDLGSAQWSLGRGEESRRTLRRALRLVARDGASPVRARLLSQQVATLMLQGRYQDACVAAEDALEAAEAAGAVSSRGFILNRMGVSLFALGRHDEGEAALQEAIALAHAEGDLADAAYAFANLADALHHAGRSAEAHRTALAGQAEARGNRAERWLALVRAEIAFDRGDWDETAEQLPAVPAYLTGTVLADANLCRAALALGRGDLATARDLLCDTEPLLADSLEPQYISAYGVNRAELARREGDLERAREAVETAIDRIEFCSEDGARLARVAAVGVAVEADAAQRARDRGDREAEAASLQRASLMLERVRAATEPGRPVGEANRLTAEAEAARAAGRADPAAWATAAGAWEALARPYPAALARWREAEAHVEAGDREAAAAAAGSALAAARRLGAAWLATEVEGLAARGRVRLGAEREARSEPVASQDEEAFGLTPRERQVLALLARGATNREIGAELYMAEKTASVHVSRILAKLDVRSRTEAAALAHRQGLEEFPVGAAGR